MFSIAADRDATAFMQLLAEVKQAVSMRILGPVAFGYFLKNVFPFELYLLSRLLT